MNENEFTGGAFFKFLAERRLMGTRSRSTGEVFWPPRPINPKTHSDDMEWVELSGKGKLVAFTVVYIAPTPMLAAGYDRKNPYLVGVVQLQEGPKMSGQLIGLGAARPEEIKIGQPMRATFMERGAGEARRTVLAFEPISS